MHRLKQAVSEKDNALFLEEVESVWLSRSKRFNEVCRAISSQLEDDKVNILSRSATLHDSQLEQLFAHLEYQSLMNLVLRAEDAHHFSGMRKT